MYVCPSMTAFGLEFRERSAMLVSYQLIVLIS